MKNLTGFAFAFFIGRGSQFFIPILLGLLLASTVYGLIEIAMAFALNIVAVFSLGFNALLPRSIVRREQWVSANLIYSYIFIVSLSLLALSIFLSIWYEIASIALAFASVLLMESSYSSKLKSNGQRSFAILNDALIWFLILFWAVINETLDIGKDSFLRTIWFAYLVYASLYLKNINFKAWSPITSSEIYKHIKSGIKIILIGISSSLVITSGRIIMSTYLDLETFADYAQIYRFTILPLIIHQFCVIFLFRKLYSGNIKLFEDYSSKIFALVILFSATLAFGLYFISALETPFKTFLEKYLLIFIICLCIVPFWGGIAINEISFSQNTSSIYPILFSLIYISAFSALIFFLSIEKNILNLSIIHLLFVCSYHFINSLTLKFARCPVSLTPALLSFIISVFLSYYLLSNLVLTF